MVIILALLLATFASVEVIGWSARTLGVDVVNMLSNDSVFSSLPPASKALIVLVSPFNAYESAYGPSSIEPPIRLLLWFVAYGLSLVMLAILLIYFHRGRWLRLFLISLSWALAASYMTSIAHWLYAGIPTYGSSVVEVDLSLATMVVIASLWPLSDLARKSKILIFFAYCLSVLIITMAFYDNTYWPNHLVGAAFFVGALVQLYYELRGQPAPAVGP